jgi:hypothetical protein
MIPLTKVVQNLLQTKENPMTDLSAVLEQLKAERAQLDKAISALSGVVGINSGTSSSNGRRGKRTMSLSARKRIAAAQRSRWAKVRGREQKVVSMPQKRTMSAAARKRIAAAQRERWAKVRAKKAA